METTLEMSVVGPAGAPGPTGAGGATGAPPLRLVDATERIVGPVVYARWYVQEIADSLPGIPLVHVLVRHDALGGDALLGVDYAGEPAGTIYWSAANCTGDALAPGNTLMSVVEVIGGTAFVPGAPAAVVTIGSRESMNTANGCTGITSRGGCCQMAAGSIPGARVMTTTSFAALGIVPPLRAVAP